MASAFGHAALAIASGRFFDNSKRNLKLYSLGILAAVMPDFDVLAFKFGIPYEHLFGHRGFTHSFFFAILSSILMVLIFYPKRKLFESEGKKLIAYFIFCSASHPILDAMTTGGMGVAFFSPFSNTRHFLPWRMIEVSPLSVKTFFTKWGLEVIQSELLWIGIPALVIYCIATRLGR